MKGLEIKTDGMKALEESVLFRTMTKEEILDVIDAMDPRARRLASSGRSSAIVSKPGRT